MSGPKTSGANPPTGSRLREEPGGVSETRETSIMDFLQGKSHSCLLEVEAKEAEVKKGGKQTTRIKGGKNVQKKKTG